MNTLSYRELKDWYINNEDAKKLAEEVFGKAQPRILQTGFYSAPSWNWGYKIGLVMVKRTETNKIFEDQVYEVVTQFGSVVAARREYIPTFEK